ncbi:MAG: RES family NAD+ phosphorylase [Gemmatimonadaceae bacterium]|nr:RES family NAD+ phosphorylase [Gemmatimonadaceae bacterium]
MSAAALDPADFPRATDLAGRTVARIVAGDAQPLALLDTLYGAQAPLALALLAEHDATLQPQLGHVQLVDADDWPATPGAGWLLAPFVRDPLPATRFSGGGFGVWYGATTVETALREVGHHLAAWLRTTAAESPATLPRLELAAEVAEPAHRLVDLRGKAAERAAPLLDPHSYAWSQPFGVACRDAREWGITWPSVRDPGGTCLGVLRPPVIAAVQPVAAWQAHWDGRRVSWGAG